MFPYLAKIGGFTLYTHGLLAVIGIVVGSYILFLLAKRARLSTTYLFDNIIYSILIGIIGARITYFLLYREQFSSFLDIFRLWEGGMVSYGGFIPGTLLFIILLKFQKAKVDEWLAISSIAFSTGLVWGRIGNVLAGEYAGRLTASRFNIDGFIPVTLYEAFLLITLSSSLFLIYRSSKASVKYLFFLFVFFYTAGRFVLDFWRDESNLAINLSTGQVVSLSLFFLALILLVFKLFQGRRKGEVIPKVSG